MAQHKRRTAPQEQDQEAKVARVTIPGYTYGTTVIPRSPLTMRELELLERAVMLEDEDIDYLRMSYEILKDQVENIMDVWYGLFASQPHLMFYFTRESDGQVNPEYVEAVRKRFGQWILDTARAQYDQDWLDYQFEIGHRHYRTGKGQTDHVQSVEIMNFRYLPVMIYPLWKSLRPFLEEKHSDPDDVEKMHQAWLKAFILHVTLWSQPYLREEDF